MIGPRSQFGKSQRGPGFQALVLLFFLLSSQGIGLSASSWSFTLGGLQSILEVTQVPSSVLPGG